MLFDNNNKKTKTQMAFYHTDSSSQEHINWSDETYFMPCHSTVHQIFFLLSTWTPNPNPAARLSRDPQVC